MTSLPEICPSEPSVAQLRDNLIDLTVALADVLAQGGDADRLQTLSDLYAVTRRALAARDLQAVR